MQWIHRAALAAFVLTLAACGAGKAEKGAENKRGGGPGPESLPPRDVRLAHVEQGNLARTLSVTGTLAADEQVELGFKVAGRIQYLAVDLGTRVRRGQTLAQLSLTEFNLRVAQAQNALDQARARLGLLPGHTNVPVDPRETALAKQAAAVLEQARLTRQRMSKLFAEQLISREEMDAVEASYQVADARLQDAIEEGRSRQALLAQRKSELDLARQQVADAALTAPFDGFIRERTASPGDYVTPGQPVVVLVKVHPLRLKLAVPERDAPDIRPGQTVRLSIEGDPGRYEGRIVRTSPAITEDNRTYLVEAEVPNPTGQLKPGSFARADIVTEASTPALLVPAEAVVTFAGIDKVLSVENGKAAEKRVKLGRRASGKVEILEGVAAGDPVVLAPGNLVTGQPVRTLG